MKLFFKYFFYVFICIVVVDLANRVLFWYTFNHAPANSELAARYKYHFMKRPTDILILGASRAEFHYDCKVLEDTLNMKAYNSGIDGFGVYSYYITLKQAYKNGPLKYVILDYTNSEFSYEWNQNRISKYFPYYWENEDVRTIVNEAKGPQTPMLMLSSLYQFNSGLHSIMWAFLQKSKNYHGYIALPYTGRSFDDWVKKHSKPEIAKPLSPSDTANIKYLKTITKLCKENKTKIIICVSPSLQKTSPEEYAYIINYCYENQIPYWNFEEYEPIVKDTKNFKDLTHLNGKGATKFSKVLAGTLKRYDLGKESNHIYYK